METNNIETLLRLDLSELENQVISELSDTEIEEVYNFSRSKNDPEFRSSESLFEFLSYSQISSGLEKWIRELIFKAEPILKEKVCKEFDYCNKKVKGELIPSDDLTIILMAVEIILTVLTQVPVTSTVVLAIFILRKKYIDKLCGCPE